ncbi:SAG-related sequence [Besnoitia besnoiti]|uniref:SAG-related sequence n=1 Tax=Besnoitia besnoiti TaxID=94643 RepID=A0A2A9MJ57_BESBE|nr:SAG-related sequence [Besnoitia besnoiti]PFH35627.1 SAG-related sequence [Besnoitia besnoiti]
MAIIFRRERRRGGLKYKARKLLATCVGGVLLLTSAQAGAEPPQDGFLRQALQENEPPSINQNTATCTLASGSSTVKPTPTELTLSDEQLKATLLCTGENPTRVPKELGNVCQDMRTKIESGESQCKIGEDASSSGSVITLTELLAAGSNATWEDNTSTERETKKSWTLSLVENDLPLTDKYFYVGCEDGVSNRARGNSSCKVPVKILARRSSTKKNVVTCAYGKNSNKAPVEVEMTQEQNTLTVVCGTEGTIHPEKYSSVFCEKEDQELCTKSYSEILPKLNEEWWTEETDKSVKLTIPSTDFPAKDQSFYVGCNPTEGKYRQPALPAEAAAENEASNIKLTKCQVLVTVKASRLPLSGGQGRGMAAAASGAAVLTGLLAGTL